MDSSSAIFRAVIDVCKAVVPILAALTFTAALVVWRRRTSEKDAATMLLVGLVVLLCIGVAAGTGSCLVGGFVAGRGICSLGAKGASDALHPATDFVASQLTYSIPLALAVLIGLVALLHLIPGRATGWERFVFLVSTGRRGRWTYTPPRNERYEQLVRQTHEILKRQTDPTTRQRILAMLKEAEEHEARSAKAIDRLTYRIPGAQPTTASRDRPANLLALAIAVAVAVIMVLIAVHLRLLP